MRSRTHRQQYRELFDTAFAAGIGQALAGWAAEFTHKVLARDPELRRRLHENWRFIFERLASNLPEPRRQKRTPRRRS